MYRAVSALRRSDRISLSVFARCFTNNTFAERDIVILRQKSDPSAPPILTKPLAPGAKIETHKGALKHADIIGKLPRDVVTSSSGGAFRIHHVSLHDYVRLSKRLVTPVYPADANLIVSLFDIHVSPPALGPSTSNEPRLEILEAGTGHGSLTLHLSRAIHAANPPKPVGVDLVPIVSKEEQEDDTEIGAVELAPIDDDPLSAWKANRKAVIHTIDVSAKYSKHAMKVVRGFRHGLYADNADFHVGDVSEWVKQEITQRADHQTTGTDSTPFLTHAFLDLPSTHTHLSTVASALRNDGILIVFNPSITQIAECMQKIKQDGIPLFLDQTLELGTNGTSGGREWDVRAVKPRAAMRKEEDDKVTPPDGEAAVREVEQVVSDAENQTPWSLVCRPKVGDRVVGGGFLGVFRKMNDSQ
ncbi:S-adenosyl-L-methionine-dependent methyltransferase [Delphinella strobiligena]|nr:S-adenosyl-L-methionine-dependent methyltransferase [Delphinella strobiligena]